MREAQFEKHLLSLIHEAPSEYWNKYYNKSYDHETFINSLNIYDSIKNARMHQDSSNLEVLTEILRIIPDGVQSIKDILKNLEEETTKSLLKLDDEIMNVVNASQNLTQKIEYMKADFQLVNNVKLAQKRENLIHNSEIQVWVITEENKSLFDVTKSTDWKECLIKRTPRKGSDPNRMYDF